jgi:hypothetical protein
MRVGPSRIEHCGTDLHQAAIDALASKVVTFPCARWRQIEGSGGSIRVRRFAPRIRRFGEASRGRITPRLGPSVLNPTTASSMSSISVVLVAWDRVEASL